MGKLRHGEGRKAAQHQIARSEPKWSGSRAPDVTVAVASCPPLYITLPTPQFMYKQYHLPPLRPTLSQHALHLGKTQRSTLLLSIALTPHTSGPDYLLGLRDLEISSLPSLSRLASTSPSGKWGSNTPLHRAGVRITFRKIINNTNNCLADTSSPMDGAGAAPGQILDLPSPPPRCPTSLSSDSSWPTWTTGTGLSHH